MIEKLRSDEIENLFPAPAPDGERLVFSSSTWGAPGNLMLLDLETGETTALGVIGANSRWSPDGAWIAYLTPSEGLALIRPDGTSPRELVPGDTRIHGGFDWSADGQKILAVRDPGEVIRITVSTGGIEVLSGLGSANSIARFGP